MATALRLPDLPREPLARILALACDTPEQLFAAGAACASLRAAAGCTDASLAPLWNRVMALMDPAGALARPSDFVMRDSEACGAHAAGYGGVPSSSLPCAPPCTPPCARPSAAAGTRLLTRLQRARAPSAAA
jgi:hypothetical protein